MDFLLTWVVFLDGLVKWFTNNYLCLRSQNFRGDLFLRITQYNATRTHTYPYEHVCKSYPYEHL
jgi:hypothetical protein